MPKKTAINPLTVALGTVFTASLANITISNAAENPFSMKPLSGGYMMLAEGNCGEGKCGAAKASEGRCGLARMDADNDGKVTRDEFIKGHEVMFDKIDQDSDGVIDQAEGEAHLNKMMGFMKEGKCGEGKCGGTK